MKMITGAILMLAGVTGMGLGAIAMGVIGLLGGLLIVIGVVIGFWGMILTLAAIDDAKASASSSANGTTSEARPPTRKPHNRVEE